MKKFTATLTGIAPLMMSRYHNAPKLEKESADDYERRTWRMKAHTNADGFIVIPGRMFQSSLADAAKYASEKIKGERNATWTKHFEAGVAVMDDYPLTIKPADLSEYWIMVDSNGKRGSGTRVNRCFPCIPKWAAKVVYHILDEKITIDVFSRMMETSGLLIGIGSFRPRNRGMNGRFRVEKITGE